MTITPFEIYLISFADNFLATTAIVMLASVLACIFALIVTASCNCEEEESAKKFMKKAASCFLIALGLFTVVPNSKTIAAMYLVPAVVNNEHLQNSAGNALGLLEELTKKWLKDMVKQKGEREVEVKL